MAEIRRKKKDPLRALEAHASCRESRESSKSGLRQGPPSIESQPTLSQTDPAAVHCPECNGTRLYHDGQRYLSNGQTAQRFLCRNCGYRFSESSKDGRSKTLNVVQDNGGIAQVCELEGSKNLTEATINSIVAGEGIDQTQQGLIVEFQWKMKKRNKALSTITNRTMYLTRLVKLGADLTKPDTVETVFATEEFTEAAKYNAVKAYVAFAKAYHIVWEPIEVSYQPKEPFYPLEEEIDLLIAACSRVTKTFLQVAKDTGARVGEIRKIQWTDIDEKAQTIAINHPEKGSRARTVKVSEKTLVWIKELKKNHGDYVFNPTFVSSRKTFNRTRKRMAEITNNPRLLKIHFHTCRHWRGSREYEKTGEIYDVKDLLGHKCISSTDRYQHSRFSSEEYITKRPKTPQEEDDLINAGFAFVRYDHKEDGPIYRKRK